MVSKHQSRLQLDVALKIKTTPGTRNWYLWGWVEDWQAREWGRMHTDVGIAQVVDFVEATEQGPIAETAFNLLNLDWYQAVLPHQSLVPIE